MSHHGNDRDVVVVISFHPYDLNPLLSLDLEPHHVWNFGWLVPIWVGLNLKFLTHIAQSQPKYWLTYKNVWLLYANKQSGMYDVSSF